MNTSKEQQSTEIMEDVACNLCGSSESVELCKIGRFNRPARNVVCKRCGLVYLTPRKKPADLKKYYEENGYTDDYSPLTDDLCAGRLKKASLRLSFLERFVPVTDSGKFLEIGCASGELVSLLKKRGTRAEGIEPSTAECEAASRLHGLKIRNGMFEDFSGDERIEKGFTAIMFFHVFEHMADPDLMLRVMYDWLDPDGYLYVEVPDILARKYYPRQKFFRDVHYFSFTRRTFTHLLAKNKFRILGFDETYNNIRAVAQKDPGIASPELWPAEVSRIVRHVALWDIRYRSWQAKDLSKQIIRKALLGVGIKEATLHRWVAR